MGERLSEGRVHVAVVGKDCRTDALVQQFAHSPDVAMLTGVSEVAPPGMLRSCDRFLGDVSLTDVALLTDFFAVEPPDLIVIGPEEPLAAGLVDRLEDDLGIPCFGPRQALARIESSKVWTRELVDRHEIPGNPNYRVVRDANRLRKVLSDFDGFVVKPDGLTGGKGVRLYGEHLKTLDDAFGYAESLINEDGVVLIEERLEGEEFSLQTITDGETAIHCPLVQDHKRAYSGDIGPNTGGMGSYSCADHGLPFLDADDVATAKAINEAVLGALRQEIGRPYRGVLYGGFIATASGVKLIEYNCRFGDPEAMNVLPLLTNDLLSVCSAAVQGRLRYLDVRFSSDATVCKYVVPKGYPSGKGAGDLVKVPADLLNSTGDSRLYWAAVNQESDGSVRLTGSRALAVLGVGRTLAEAEVTAEAAASRVEGEVRHREDIGTAPLVQQRVHHMKQLRGRADTTCPAVLG